MLKKILKLEGAQKLSKNEQKTIKGGAFGPGGCYHPSKCGEAGGIPVVSTCRWPEDCVCICY
jgi:hypothetical protein